MPQQFNLPRAVKINLAGRPYAGATATFYQTGTDTPQTVYQDSALLTPHPLTIEADDDGYFPVIWLDQDAPADYRVLILSATGSTLDDVSGIPRRTIFTSDELAQSLDGLKRTDAEIAVGVTPVNFAYGVGYPERYGNNTTAGTTSMTAAVQAAINVAKKGGAGGSLYIGLSGPYLIDGALDLTTPVGSTYSGFTIRGVGNANPAASNPAAVISLVHNAIAFDCTGTTGITFENLTIQAFKPTYPTICFLLARNTNAASQTMRFNNVQVIGNFSKALVYNFGSEDDQYTACSFYNRAPDANSCTMYFTSTNILGIASTFTAIAPGSPQQSTIDHKIIGGEFAHQGGQVTNDVIRLDAVSSVKLFGPWMLCASGSANGRSLIYMHTVNGPTNLVTLVGVQGEDATNLQTYGIFFDGIAGATPSYWAIESCTFPNANVAIVANTNVTCDNFHIRALSNQSVGGGISLAGKLQNSHIDELGLSGLAIQLGSSQNNIFNCNSAAVSITTALGGDYWACVQVPTWTPVTSGLTIVGALTVSHAIYQRQGSEVTVTVGLSAATSIACSAGALLGGLPLAAIADGAVTVTNSTVPSAIGSGQVSGTSIVLPAISVGANVRVSIVARYFVN